VKNGFSFNGECGDSACTKYDCIKEAVNMMRVSSNACSQLPDMVSVCGSLYVSIQSIQNFDSPGFDFQ
jgi:hypothetical protein